MGLVLLPRFWESESTAPLLRRNHGFVTIENAQQRCDQVKSWLDFIPSDVRESLAEASQRRPCKTGLEDMDRIFYQDAVRTFTSEEFREVQVMALCSSFEVIRDYHQGLGFIVAFLLLFLPHEDVVTVCLYLNQAHLQGYFKLHNHDYLRDTRVFEQLLMKRDRQLGLHLQEYTVSGAYCSKWWIGMSLHVFPFVALFRWWEVFLTGGSSSLFRLGISICLRNREFILAQKQTAPILELLRFERAVHPDDKKRDPDLEDSVVSPEVESSFFLDMVEHSIEIDVDDCAVQQLRKEVSEAMELEEIARNKLRSLQDSDDEIVFSDEESDEVSEGNRSESLVSN